MRTLTSEANITLFERLIATPALYREISIDQRVPHTWVVYGSLVTNKLHEHSDIDLLFIHDSVGTPRRVQATYVGRPVTIYVVPLHDFQEDGLNRRYGGYFSGKVLNPFLHSGKLLTTDSLLKVGAEFIGIFAAAQAAKRHMHYATPDALVADMILAFVALCPPYASYFLRYFISDQFHAIWESMKELIPQGFLDAGIVHRLPDNLFEYQHLPPAEEVHRYKVLSIARFWAFGTHCHGSYRFPDYYTEKAESFIVQNRLQDSLRAMEAFLQDKVKEART